MWFQETALSEVSSAGEKERMGWFEAVSADDVEAVKEMLKESPACVNMVDEVSIVTLSRGVSIFNNINYIECNGPGVELQTLETRIRVQKLCCDVKTIKNIGQVFSLYFAPVHSAV